MRKLVTILILAPLFLNAQFFVAEEAHVYISEGANLEIGGDLVNTGRIDNMGTLSLYGNWSINEYFNGLDGELQFLGGDDQMVSIPGRLTVSGLTINEGGNTMLSVEELTVTDRIDFQSGIISIGENTRFILDGASVIGGTPFSYLDGTVIHKGGGIKKFPIGSNGVYSPVTLLNVFGVDTEIAASFQSENTFDPIPSDSLLGVSHMGIWEVELINGGTNATKVELEFDQIDLSDLRNRRNIRHIVNSPVIAFAYEPEGIYGSLGVETLLNSDSLTFGTITGEYEVQPSLGQKLYFAVGLAPRIPNQGLLFVPEAFSPNATDPDNQAFRIFGENISEENFSLTIYNRLGVRVYSTSSFSEANNRGWDGTNQTSGAEEPSGIYYYSLRLRFDSGLVRERNGAFYLVK